MAKKDEVLKQVDFYENKYRNCNLERFKISELYDLFPDKTTEHKIDNSWPKPWTHSSKAGVYLFLDENLEVVYIGKSNQFGYRFGSYFAYDEEKKCRIKHSWKTFPRFVITIAVPDDSKFECTALEEYLLSTIVTSDNTLFNRWE
jgi:hypothetical protein